MEEEKDLFSGGSSGLTIKEQVSKYLAYYPLFIISIIICIGAGILYLRYAIPMYKASALVFVKNDKTGNTSTDLIKTAITGDPMKSNLDNEVQLMSSQSLMERVVSKNGFNISYIYLGKLRNTDLYLDAPFRLIPQTIKDSSSPLFITLSDLNNDGGVLQKGTSDKGPKLAFKWNSSFAFDNNTYSLIKRPESINKNDRYFVAWKSLPQAAAEVSSQLTIGTLDKRTSILQLSILTENKKRGMDILNALSAEYNLNDIQDRNVVSQNTIRFIDDRLSVVSSDLSGVEGRLENYQGSKGLIDVNVQSNQSFENSNNLQKEIADNNIKQAVAKSIMNYFNTPGAQDKLVPSTLGLDDPTLGALIGSYNDLQMRKQKEAPSLAEGGIIMKDLNNQLNATKGSILEALQNINGNLKQKENSLQQQNGQYRQFLSALPSNERAMQEIKRKQSITEGLYLYLLQKREEAAVSSTSSNVPNYKQIDPAVAWGPVSPNSTNIKIYCVLLGLVLPFGIIFLRDLLNDKIMTRKDITNRVDIPVVGEVSHTPKKQTRGISIMQRDLVGEEFRIIRTNLYFLQQKKEKQVILVTSSLSGEGKSFIALNLAGVLAIPGKKVALLEFDMRKPTIIDTLNIDRPIGLNEYFNGEIGISDIYHEYEDIPSLHIYPAGSTPQYPADLFLSEKIPQLFKALKADYDYVIIDSAPIGLVSDALVLGGYSDIVLFVIRQRNTLKKQLEFVSELFRTKKLTNIGFIFNDVKRGGKVGYYGYGNTYGKNYGYEKTKKNKKRKAIPA
ncbi:MAG: polysaccharide biosynthesis tyrosine autokinase [Ginsengibacter sp.]